jgi:hypothetical protein
VYEDQKENPHRYPDGKNTPLNNLEHIDDLIALFNDRRGWSKTRDKERVYQIPTITSNVTDEIFKKLAPVLYRAAALTTLRDLGTDEHFKAFGQDSLDIIIRDFKVVEPKSPAEFAALKDYVPMLRRMHERGEVIPMSVLERYPEIADVGKHLEGDVMWREVRALPLFEEVSPPGVDELRTQINSLWTPALLPRQQFNLNKIKHDDSLAHALSEAALTEGDLKNLAKLPKEYFNCEQLGRFFNAINSSEGHLSIEKLVNLIATAYERLPRARGALVAPSLTDEYIVYLLIHDGTRQASNRLALPSPAGAFIFHHSNPLHLARAASTRGSSSSEGFASVPSEIKP